MDKLYAYYPLTEEESKQKELIYESNEYTLKAVNLTLEGLLDFIKDEKT